MSAANVRFLAGDVQGTAFEVSFDYVFGRCGTMFFANPWRRFATCARRWSPVSAAAP